MDDRVVTAYQELLELEKQKIDKFGLKEPPEPDSFLSNGEIRLVCYKHNVEPEQLLAFDLLVEYRSLGWRTIHFDLIYRLVHIRNRETQRPIPLEYRIELQSEPVPDFGRYKFNGVLPELIPNESTREILLFALNEWGYEGLSSHQLPIVKELLSEKPKYKVAAIVAPTASGKTLAFFLPVMVKAIERSRRTGGISSVLVYPRKALERDQLQRFLALVDSINRGRDCYVTIGIDDGDTKRLNQIQDGEPYREMKCVECSSGTLHIERKQDHTLVKCDKCSKEYPFLIASKDEIWKKKPTILITNVYTIYRRLLSPARVRMFMEIDYLVFDEAHVYTDYLGGHVFHIIKLLRHATRLNGSNTYFVFSSATIPNPQDFIARLTGVKTNEIFYIDYKKSLENVKEVRRRLLLLLYLLPHPDSSVETLTEALILAVALWCHRHNFKAITFVDSVAEISTLSDYIHTTILGARQGREITDHMYNAHNATENSYNWLSLAPRDKAADRSTFSRFVLSEYKGSIGIHYGQLPHLQRAKVEDEFSQGRLKLILSTSTLELGIDLSNVAAIIQHKLPLTPEGIVQRVGRSGRSSDCLRIALGIIALQSTPMSTLYMFDESLRGRLADPSLLPPARVGRESASIRLQHTLSLLLYKRALENKPTFIAEKSLRSKPEVFNALKEIAGELNEELLAFNNQVGLFDDDNILKEQVEELRDLLSCAADSKINADLADLSQTKRRREDALVNIEGMQRKIQHVLQQIWELRSMFEKIQPLRELLKELDSLQDLLNRASRLCKELLISAKSSYNTGNRTIIQRWYEANSTDLERIARNVPDSDVILSRFHQPLNNHFLITMRGDYKSFRVRYGFGLDEILNVITGVSKSLGSSTEKGLVSFLRELPNIAGFLQSVDLSALVAYEALERIQNELQIKPRGIDIIDAINLLLLNRTRFSLMLDPPAPELQLIGTEEA